MPPAQTSARPARGHSVWGPRAWPFHLVGLVCVVAAAWLGWWQVEAWQAQREAEARDLTNAEPLPVAEVLGPDDPFPARDVGRPVHTTGTWVSDGTVYVEGREHEGRDGYWVVTPLEIGPGDSALLVVRGWTPSVEQAPEPPSGRAEVTGWLQPGEGTRGLVDQEPDDDVIPQLRVADALQHLDQDLYDGYLVSTGSTTEGGPTTEGDPTTEEGLTQADLAQLPEVGRFTALRNLLYAVEWWVFGAFAAFVWWRWVRDEQEVAEAAAAGGDDVSPAEPT